MTQTSLKRVTTACSFVLVLAASLALRATLMSDQLSGHWEAAVTGESKTFSIEFDFKVTGNSLGGTVGFPSQDRQFPITEGKIDGNKVAFKGFGIWTGTLNGNELTLTRELDGGKKQHMVAHRTGS